MTYDLMILGINTIDQQHADIIAMLERLSVHIPDPSIIVSAIDSLADMLGEHFMFESNFTNAATLSKETIASHKQAHQHIIDMLITIRDGVIKTKHIDHDLVMKLIDVVKNHVEQEDVLYVSWYKSYRKSQ